MDTPCGVSFSFIESKRKRTESHRENVSLRLRCCLAAPPQETVLCPFASLRETPLHKKDAPHLQGITKLVYDLKSDCEK
jgi:hypothetical protein